MRAPNMLFTHFALGRIAQTNLDLFNVQNQMATGRAVNRPSDDSIKAATISVLDERLERSEQRLRNLDHADAALSVLDSTLGDATELAIQAKEIASSQLSFGFSGDDRAAQAPVIGSIIEAFFRQANSESAIGYMFGGSTTGKRPIEAFLGGYRSTSEGTGIINDINLGSSVPLSLPASNSVGSVSARHSGTVDLQPDLISDSRLVDASGARGLGITLGSINFQFDGGPTTTVDLTGADTVGDVVDSLEAAIRTHEQDTGTSILGPGGVYISGDAIGFDVFTDPAATGSPPQLEFLDIGQGVTAQDLGLVSTGALNFSSTAAVGESLQPNVTWLTPISAMQGVSGPLGEIRLNNAGRTSVVDLSSAQSLQDVRNAIEGAGLGLRVEINGDRTGINVINEVAGLSKQAMSIEEVSGSGLTATSLGIRTFSADTRLEDFNFGRGVNVLTGGVDPETGNPDPSRDVDFSITLGDAGQTAFTVNLRPQDTLSVGTVLSRINAQAAAQGVNVPADFQAGLSNGVNGIVLRQNNTFGTGLTVLQENNSQAYRQLGLADGTYDVPSASFISEDRAKVRVDSVFTHLTDLRDALERNDTSGIGLAGEDLEASIDQITENRALVGGFANRVQAATRLEEDQVVLDERIRSELGDVDFAEAAVRFSLLQTQLQAALQTTASASQLTLLSFLG